MGLISWCLSWRKLSYVCLALERKDEKEAFAK